MSEVAPRVKALRAAFDASFAEPYPEPVAPERRLIHVRSGERTFFLDVAELSGIHPCPELGPVPSRRDTLLGLAAHRGKLLCVLRLPEALGGKSGARAPRWIAICRARLDAAIAFDELLSYRETSREEVVSLGSEIRVPGLCALVIAGELRVPLLDLAELCEGSDRAETSKAEGSSQ
ncbi:MAG TPA: chemotaxis protein CheW [Polyangiaceae bacterium]|nr:chemotaxis protein CheW [Polyangiaceae bacterium]